MVAQFVQNQNSLKNQINASPKPAVDIRAFLDEAYAQLTVDQVYTHVAHQFKQSGNRHRGGCPFHESKSGTSFVVSEGSLLFHCAGCQFGGSAVDYLHSIKVGRWEKPRGRDFIEAAKELALKAGTTFPSVERSPEEIESIRLWESRREILLAVTEYGSEVLWSSRGIDARNYLINERGFTVEQIKSLNIGLYLDRKEVETVLLKKGYKLDDIKNAGVVWSKLEGYILFPWNDSLFRPLTIYGRYQTKVPPQDRPKTIALKGEGTKQSPLYFDRALQAGHKDIVLVEGVIDAALLQVLGDTRVCAYVGASCSEGQIKTLVKRGIKSVTLCGDPDAGGDNGTLSNINRILAAGIDVYVAPKLPDGLDPDEFVNRVGIEGWRKHIDSADHAFTYMARNILNQHDITLDRGKAATLAQAISFERQFTQFKDKLSLETFFWKEICERLGINFEELRKDDGGGNGGTRGNGDNGDSGDGDGFSDEHPEQVYKSICFALGLDFSNCVTLQHFDGWIYRQIFGGGDGDWWVNDSAFYYWDEQKKSWVHKPDNYLYKLIADTGEKAYKLKYTKDLGWMAAKPYECNTYKESAFKYIRSRLERLEPPAANNHLQAFRNCVADMRSGETMPHNKENYLTNIIPYDYEKNLPCPEVFRQFIADSFGEDMLEVIRAFTSMFLDPTAPYGRFPHLIGQSGGGKGTLGRFWSSLFGESGSGSAAHFEDISTPEGRHQYLTGKRIFGFPDVGGYATGVRAFYELVDNGSMSGRALFNPVAYSKQWNVHFWLASVNHLQIENAGDGWARRAYPIPVKSRGVKPDPDLSLKLEAVKADVISWALAMPREERSHILLSPPESERAINLALDAALYGDSTKSFVDLCLRPTATREFVPHHQLHSWYVAYCKEHGYTPLGMSKFISHLGTVLPRNEVARRWSPMVNGNRERIPAGWEYLAPVPGVFVKWEHESRDSRENAQPPQNPTWICLKARCSEGGLMEFEDFWNPPDTPGGDGGDGGNQPNQPSPTTGGGLAFSDVETLKPSHSLGVQGVQGENCPKNHPGQAETQSQCGCPGCPTVPPKSFAMDLDQNQKKEFFEETTLNCGGTVGVSSLDTLDTRSVTDFQGVQGEIEPHPDAGQLGHPDNTSVRAPLRPYSLSPNDPEAVEGSAGCIRECIAEMSGEMIVALTENWTKEFRSAVSEQLSPEDNLAVESLAPGVFPKKSPLNTVRIKPEQLRVPTVDQIQVGTFVWVFRVRDREWLPGLVEDIEERFNKPELWFVRTTSREKIIARSLEKMRLR